VHNRWGEGFVLEAGGKPIMRMTIMDLKTAINGDIMGI
jgi:hypothetical protein